MLLALFGPTSSGKTKLSVEVARRLDGEVVVISADSRQVYRHLDIGTSKTRPSEMGGIRHEMLDVAEPVRKYELEEYARAARSIVAGCLAAGQVPFVVGGTGTYVAALAKGWDVDTVGPVRDSLRRDFPRSMAADAHAMLRRLDRDRASRVHPANYEAVINALASVMAPTSAVSAPPSLVFGLDPGQRRLDERVAATYDGQVARGLFDEVRDLADRYDLDAERRRRGRDSRNQVLHTHGYREWFDVAFERGVPVSRLSTSDRAEVRSRVVEHIRAYTRRQRTWFGKLGVERRVTTADDVLRALRPAGRRRGRG